MATKDHNEKRPHSDNNIALKPSNESGSGGQSDPEKRAVPPTRGFQGKEDPFGDETNAEIKYRTMKW
ncbi:MAG: hypothetical protein LQ347_003323, partial [Umbilicaria vellea]